MSLASWIMLAVIVLIIGAAVRGMFSSVGTSGDALFCPACGHLGGAKTVTKGSLIIELFLWLCLIVPGVIYSLWRVSSRHKACPQCGSTTMIPKDSPNAKRALEQMGYVAPPPPKGDIDAAAVARRMGLK